MPPSDELTIGVVIPALNEASNIRTLLPELASTGLSDVIVVDGGSTDGTVEIARATGVASVITAARGRGYQLAAGIAASRTDVVILLHADTRLPTEARAQITAAMIDPRVVGGAFRLMFDDTRFLLRSYAWFSRFDSAITTFGDQAIFVRRTALDAAGGMPQLMLLEDVELRKRLKRQGRFIKLSASVTTSARRFQRTGVIRTQLRNAFIVAAYWAGVAPSVLARWYRSDRH